MASKRHPWFLMVKGSLQRWLPSKLPTSLLQSLHTIIFNPSIHTGNDVFGILMYMKIMHFSQVFILSLTMLQKTLQISSRIWELMSL